MRIEFGPSDAEQAVHEIGNAVFYLILFAFIYLLAMLVSGHWPIVGIAILFALCGATVLLFRWPGRGGAVLGLCALGPVLYGYAGPLWSAVVARDQQEIVGRLLPVALVILALLSLARALVGVARFPGVRPTFPKPRW
jgi:hypothetical protein